MHVQYPGFDKKYIDRLVRSYGSLASCILNGYQTMAELGQHFGGGLYEAEVIYLIENEWAETAEDILWRRSKLGLRLSHAEAADLDLWIRNYSKSGNSQNKMFK